MPEQKGTDEAIAQLAKVWQQRMADYAATTAPASYRTAIDEARRGASPSATRTSQPEVFSFNNGSHPIDMPYFSTSYLAAKVDRFSYECDQFGQAKPKYQLRRTPVGNSTIIGQPNTSQANKPGTSES